MKILKRLEKNINCWFLILALTIFFLLRLPSIFEPYWYGDEGIYQVIGMALDKGKLLYRDIWDNKPPFLYLLYAIFGSDQQIIRFVSIIFGLLSVVIFFILSQRLLKNKKSVFVSTLFFTVIFGLPVIEGNIANAENFMILFILLSAYFVFAKKKLFLSGIILALAFLFKIVAIFDFSAFLLFLFFVQHKSFNNLLNEIKKIIPFILGFMSPILITFFYFLITGAFADFLKAILFSNVGYVGYGNKLLIPQGFLILKLILLFGFSLFLFKKRNLIPQNFLFIYLWFLFSLFNAFFSQRPYTHYLLVLLSSSSLLLGLIFSQRKFRLINIFLTVVSAIIIFTSFKFYTKNIAYYQNFLDFVLSRKTLYSYRAFFDWNTPTDYELAQFIKLKTKANDNIFIWGNNGQVYKLSNKMPPGRYIVAYHIINSEKSLKETYDSFVKADPKIVIVTSQNNPIPFKINKYKNIINIGKTEIYEKIF